MSDVEELDSASTCGKPPGGETETNDQFNLFRSYFDKKLDSLKKEIVAETSFSESSARKRKIEDHEFRSKSNKIQFRFNHEILELLERVEKSAKIKENKYLDEIKLLIKNRNKLICIADKSPGGGSR